MRVGRFGQWLAAERKFGLHERVVALFDRRGGYVDCDTRLDAVEWAPWRFEGLVFMPPTDGWWRVDVVVARRGGWEVGVWMRRPGWPVVVVTGPGGVVAVAEMTGNRWRRWRRLERAVTMLQMGGEA